MTPRDLPADIPDDVASALHAAAGAVPPHPGDLAGVRHRGRARVRHRTVTAAGFAAVAVAATIAVPFAVSAPDGPPVAGPPVVGTSGADRKPAVERAAPAPAQRLIVNGGAVLRFPDDARVDQPEPQERLTARELYDRYRDEAAVSGVLGTYAEVLPDGTVVDLYLDYLDPPGVRIRDLVAMPDGRFALIGVVDQMPGVERTDGPCIEGLDFRLMIIETDGSVSLSRNVRVRCETLTMVAADADTAWLVRDSKLVAHDLATGQERLVVESPELLPAQRHGIAYAGGRVASVVRGTAGRDCAEGGHLGVSLRWGEVSTGAVSELVVPAGCHEMGGPVRLSPDGRYAAVAFLRLLDSSWQVRVAIMDLDRGAVVQDRLIRESRGRKVDQRGWSGPYGVANRTGAIAGLAWSDETTLRVAWYEVPAEGVHWMPDLIQVETLPVP